MASKVGKWAAAPEQQKLWKSRPVKGDVGIVFAPETQILTYAQQGSTDFFAGSLQGAYEGFYDLNVQADWVRIDHIGEYDFLYLPFPVMLSQKSADSLKKWVEAGGTLVAEGCPGYFGDGGRMGVRQPGLGLDELFGARESYVEFTPDLLADLKLSVAGSRARGGIFLQAYEPAAGRAVGAYDDGRVAAVDNAFGRGRTRLVGTMCGYGYGRHPGGRSPQVFADALAYAGKEQHARSSEPRVKARLHAGAGGTYLWVANPARKPLPVQIELATAWGPFKKARRLWGAEAKVDGRTVMLTAGARDVAVIALE